MFKIGEFSKIAQTPISQLRYYDQIGLFQPEHTDPFTNYRYYSAQQLPRLNRILALRDLGLGLEQIARSLDNGVAADELRGMLTMRKAQIEQALETEALALRAVEARLRQIEHEDEPMPDVVLKSAQSQPFLSFRNTFVSAFDALGVVTEMVQQLPAHVGEQRLGDFTVVVHSEGFSFEDVDMELGFVLTSTDVEPIALRDGRQLTLGTLPAVETMATAIRVGPVENGFATYAAVGTWIEENGLEVADLVRETFIVPPRPECESEATVEIQVPIRRPTAALPSTT